MIKHIALMAAVTVFAVLGGCSGLGDMMNLQKPTASLQGVKFDSITLESAKLLFDVEIDNPYSAALPLLNMDYRLTSQSRQLLAGEADVQGSIPAHGKKVVTLPATVRFLDVVQAFKDVRPGTIIPYKADGGLFVDAPVVGKLRLPIAKEGELKAPTLPSEADWKSILLNKALK